MSIYPTGPEPVAPEDAYIQSLADPILIALWVYVAVFAGVTLLWTAFRAASTGKARHEQDDSGGGGTSVALNEQGSASISLKADLGVGGVESDRFASRARQGRTASEINSPHKNQFDSTELPKPDVVWQCYKNNLFGTFAFFLVGTFGLVIVVTFLVILMDKFWKCQFGSIDNLCFYGTYPLSGGYMNSGGFFFAFWLITLFYFGLLILMKKKVRNFFRMPCNTREAEHIWLWVPLEEEVLTKSATPLVSLLRAVKRATARKHNGYEITTPVLTSDLGTRYYVFQASRYVMNSEERFQRAMHVPVTTYDDVQQQMEGLSTELADTRRDFTGPNAIPFKCDTILQATKDEFFTLFYLYQLLVYMVWMWISYIVVGALLGAVVIFSGIVRIVINRMNQVAIARLTQHSTTCNVKRDGEWVEVNSQELVPGDVVKIKSDWLLPCDLIILAGQCVCNESALTGEAMPVLKVQVPNDRSGQKYDPTTEGKRYTLFSGTTVLQCGDTSVEQGDTLALVTCTGISTSKGNILAAILYPARVTFRYDEELPAVLFLLALYSVLVFALCLYLLSTNGAYTDYVTNFCYAVYVISLIISPLLPVALIAGQVQATVRLGKKGIFCINPSRITAAGKTRVCCFDKTGTLTTDKLNFLGARQVVLSSSGEPDLGPLAHPSDSKEALTRDMKRALASCHTVTKLGTTFIGNQVEVEMFSSTGWEIVNKAGNILELQAPGSSDRLQVLRRFEFEHTKQLMSVIVKDANGEISVFTKGSFEKMTECTEVESVPVNYQSIARGMALKGCYVLGVSTKPLEGLSEAEIALIDRDSVESGLTLMGLIGFRNELKDDTAQAISDLKDGNVRPVMITGDSAQCGHYIARACGMARADATMLLAELDDKGLVMWSGVNIEDQEHNNPIPTADLYCPSKLPKLESGEIELAITGKAYDNLKNSGDLDRLLFFIRCFARVTPANKIDVVQQFIRRGLIVGMCGDGGNDCGALRAAHVGMALSDAEASLVSPFTSKSRTCTSVVDLLKEGKAAMHTNLSSYKFLIMYGQLCPVWMLSAFYYAVLPSMLCYVMIDVIGMVGLTYALTCAHPTAKLNPERPTSSLFSATTLASVLGVLIINLSVLFGIIAWVPTLNGYLRWPAADSGSGTWWLNGDNWESTGIFWPIYFQLITSAYIFGFGAQYKQCVVKNWTLTLFYAFLFVVGAWVLLSEPNAFTKAFHVASEQFNSAGVIENTPQSVWATYQTNWLQANPGTPLCFPDPVHSEPCSPAMTLAQRASMFGIIVAGLIAACLWQGIVVDRFGKQLRPYFNNSRLSFSL